MTLLIVALAAFVGTHFLLSHPLRAPLVARLGPVGFQILYSLVAFATLGWAIHVYGGLEEVPLWTAGRGLYHPAALVMWLASVLFVGSITPANRALAGVPGSDRRPGGVLAITRHPMMWSFALWALVHGALAGDPPTLALCGAVLLLALVGAAGQDAKKQALDAGWAAYASQTSYWPLGAQLAGRRGWGDVWPGLWPVLGGTGFWLLMTWLHPSLMGAPVVGLWEWIA
ncbi:NnrU family protein [Sandaracinobacteroides saxicola]|uniref:MFS transporter n=1 Tax=Sandaracinobacteroides saxicola TaxID=2759707 RepID=A0A7G5IDT2_9SPHN|nr:NnrU family protein [Sandaracinobacteroides saxicola]QMW21524.1 MFS transporter [Sandaracinobacteroides saxicola]